MQAPYTEEMVYQKLLTLDTVGKFWFETLKDGQIDILEFDDNPKWRDAEIFITTKRLCDMYLRFCKDRNVHYPKGSAQIVKLLFSNGDGLCPAAKSYRPRQKNGSRSPGYKIPSLSECRDAFETAIGSNGALEW
jgi:hypothetical protein